MTKSRKSKKLITNKDIKELVIARLSTMSQNVNISIGSEGEFSRDELIDHVEKYDEIGKKMINIDIEFLQALKRGEFYKQNYINN